jgi:hypothetical protein
MNDNYNAFFLAIVTSTSVNNALKTFDLLKKIEGSRVNKPRRLLSTANTQ